MISILVALLIVGVSFGLVYPTAAIVYYKIASKGKMSLKQILEEIGY